MSALYGNEKPEIQAEHTKQDVLSWMVPSELKREVQQVASTGYEISFGDSDDRAYEDPSAIEMTYEMLKEKGEVYSREMGRFDVGMQAALTTVRFGAPAESARNWAKRRLQKREANAEELRSELLYDLLDVQAQPWHLQGGKALALGTIVDAHDLQVHNGDGGIYSRMSGRLTEEILEHRFDSNAGWLAGLDIRDAVVEANKKFKRMDQAKATEKMEGEMDSLADFVSAPVRPGFKDIVVNCTDSLGIRSRKEEVRNEINNFVDAADKQSFTMMSVGCGTALPMLEVVEDLRRKNKNVKLILLDQDPIALAAAEQFARQMGLEECLEIHCEQLFHGQGRKTRLLELEDILKGRKLDVCEDSGLREYFPNFLYKDLTSQIWNSLADDGIMTTGNMNKNRPQPEFLHGLMGWPIPVQMRKVKDIAKLHSEAGVPKEASRLKITQDGVYTLCFSSKSKV